MNRQIVISSELKSVGYDHDTRMLEIDFHTGGIYQYADVPLNQFRQLMAAQSKGRYFNRNIRTKYPCKRVT